MTSEAQTKANKLNAQKSTGPKTPEGKTASSRNAIVHGLSAKSLFLEGEDQAEFGTMRKRLFWELNPETILETQLVDKLAADLWRLRRIPAFEALLIDWISYQEVRTYDCNPDEVFPVACHRRSMRSRPKDESEKGRYMLGRAIEAMLSGDDVLAKLARHEVHLARQVMKTIRTLKGLKKEPLGEPVVDLDDDYVSAGRNGREGRNIDPVLDYIGLSSDGADAT